jgi:signal transduction histidine kinase
LAVIGKDPITISDIQLTSAVQPTQVFNKKRVDLSVKNNPSSGKSSRPGSVSISIREDAAGKNQSPMIQFLETNKTLNDSIPLKQIDSAYRESLGKNYKKLPYTILYKKYPQQTVRKADFEPDSSDQVITSKVFVGYNTPYSYQASFSNTPSFILGKMNMQIGGSILLLLFVLLSFVTLYRSLLAQRRLTIIKNDFISNITHELKTPIATVNVAIEALRDFGGLQNPARTKEYLDISVAELQRLGMLVDKVLKFSLFENQEIALQNESFDLLLLIKDVMDSMKLQFEKQQAVAELETIGENFMIDADKLHITSVIYNLLDNALKYSKEDPHIKVTLIRHTEYFELRISDNGVGIPEAYRAKIFEQFFRVPNGDRHNIKGYGLGLSYVNHIVQKHMGFVEIETELEKGSTFIVKIAIADMPVVHFDKGRKIIKKFSNKK